MSTLRTHFTFRVDTWTSDGESIVEHVAGVEDYQVALATYRAACERWPGTPITSRRGREMIDLLAVEEPKPKPAKIRAVSYEAAIDQLFKRMRSSTSALT